MRLFSEREIRAVVLFLPLAGLCALGVWLLRPKADPERAVAIEREMETRTDSAELFRFDPNTVEYDDLRRLGLTKREAVSLLRYRASGKVFRIREDVALCYEISDSLYRCLAPYISIGAEYALKPKNYERKFAEKSERPRLPLVPFRVDTVEVAFLRGTGIFSKRAAEAFVRWRNLAGVRDMEEFRELIYVSDSLADALEPYLIFQEPKPDRTEQPLEINRADSAALRSVSGIGEKTVVTILAYRERLGGFCRIEQLAEVPGVTESNYERIMKQIYCDSCEIQKIDINFATPNELRGHPYLPPQTLRKLLKTRQLKGGWSTIGEIVDDHILTAEEAARLAPYLRFKVHHVE